MNVNRYRKRRVNPKRLALTGLITALIIGLIIFLATRGGDDEVTPIVSVAPTAAAPTLVITPEATAEPTETPAAIAVSDAEIAAFVAGGVRIAGKYDGEKPYCVYVSKETFTIAILAMDDAGEYTRCLHTYKTAIGTGNKTRAGKYTIRDRFDWYQFSDDAYTPFTVRCTDKLRIHAPLHGEKDFNTMFRTYNYGEIGQAVTAGCLRTTCECAAWIYVNCPDGTPVVIANDSKYTSVAPPPRKSGARHDPTNPALDNSFEVPTAYFEINAEDARLAVGEQFQIAVTEIRPNYATTQSYAYMSTNAGAVSVDSSGVVSALAPGAAWVIIKANDINGAYRVALFTVE